MSVVRAVVDRRALRRYLPGDLFVIVAFLVMGEVHHGIDPIGAPGYVAETVAPFVLGWLIVAPLSGAYGRLGVACPWTAPVLAIPAWIGADVVGQSIRDTGFVHGGASPMFVLVVGFVGVASLVGSRTVVVIVNRRWVRSGDSGDGDTTRLL